LKHDNFGNFFVDTFGIPSGSRSGVASGDFNGDGIFDLAIANVAGTIGIDLKDPNGGYVTEVSILSTLPHPQGIVTADVNGDGKTDLIAFDPNGIEILLGDGSGGFTEAAGSPFVPGTGSITGISSVQAGDFNGDGKGDLFVVRTPTATGKGEIVIMLGNGTGGFTASAGAGYSSGSSNLLNAVVADFNGDGRTDIAVTDPVNDAVVLLRGVATFLQPISPTPAAGSGTTQTFTFTFDAPNGFASFTVVDVLINNFLDGRNACYVAFVPSASSVFLVDDAGDAGGPYSILTLPGGGTAQNSQCAISGGGSSFSGSGKTLTLTLAITFKPSFSGDKVFYLAAQDTASTGWHALAAWNVPGTPPTGPSVSGVTPPRAASTRQIFTVSATDPLGFADITIADVLINSFLDGRNACYVAYIPGLSAIALVDDAGDAGGPYAGAFILPGSGTASNSQCTINGATSSVTGSGNTLTLKLDITFNQSFAGDRVIYAAAGSNTTNSGWLAVGTNSIP
jgi:hypothetical protein